MCVCAGFLIRTMRFLRAGVHKSFRHEFSEDLSKMQRMFKQLKNIPVRSHTIFSA